MKRLRIAYLRFTSCCGCQLTLLNAEGKLAQLAERVELVRFPMASSRPDDGGELDLVLVEGSISRPEELTELLEMRRRARRLAAVGACALTGGINVLAGRDRARQCRDIYGEIAGEKATFPPQPISRFVRVDLEVAGCPPEGAELLQVLAGRTRGVLADLPEYAVCMECRLHENRCLLLADRLPCLGPVTRAGCGALCPSFGIACESCRGPAAEANHREMYRLLIGLGLPEREVESRLERFAGDDHG